MILTTEEAAIELRVAPSTIRTLVDRGELTPLVPGARPLRFDLMDVANAQVRRLTMAERAQLDALAQTWLDMVSNTVRR